MAKLQDALKVRGYPEIPGIEEALRNRCKRIKSCGKRS
ncbi:hypothetical protein FOTG_03751 [Fusarium oxysporum f. sp. vasinfectum 25433]|uniref:Uncharacterized protein n=1 Tax=Fusarium oxysporum f. sp. vasinfectum 25433 TaxID=1089449 RepID=X0M1R1_FUSOX|nr:hypothetical protein FOTG_03751 [Fusarium oxysporum f. sp. vasinfectum 25433]